MVDFPDAEGPLKATMPVGNSTALACNAAAFPGGAVVIDRRAERTIRALGRRGFRVTEVDTGEFLKSGGSVFCMKQLLF